MENSFGPLFGHIGYLLEIELLYLPRTVLASVQSLVIHIVPCKQNILFKTVFPHAAVTQILFLPHFDLWHRGCLFTAVYMPNVILILSHVLTCQQWTCEMRERHASVINVLYLWWPYRLLKWILLLWQAQCMQIHKIWYGVRFISTSTFYISLCPILEVTTVDIFIYCIWVVPRCHWLFYM